MGVYLQSFTGASGMSNALKIGGNVLHSITTHKRCSLGLLGKRLVLSQHVRMLRRRSLLIFQDLIVDAVRRPPQHTAKEHENNVKGRCYYASFTSDPWIILDVKATINLSDGSCNCMSFG